MQDEYILRMSELADRDITDVPTINILICCLLYKSENEISTDDLYEIAVSSGIINYFSFQESLNHLITNKLITVSGNKYVLLENGISCATTLKKYAPKSFRDKILLYSVRYFSREKLKKELVVNYEALDVGCYVIIRYKDREHDMMNLKIYAPDMIQAKKIGDRVYLDPSGFYGKIMNLVLSDEENTYDLSDN